MNYTHFAYLESVRAAQIRVMGCQSLDELAQIESECEPECFTKYQGLLRKAIDKRLSELAGVDK